jgi:hypothetical protein
MGINRMFVLFLYTVKSRMLIDVINGWGDFKSPWIN